MKLMALRGLVAAVEEGSLRAGARKLGVSQPALSKMVRDLETELAASLLLRSSQGVLLTAQGKVLFDHALQVTRELALAVDEINQLSGRMTGVLSIAAVPLAVLLLIPETLRTFGQAFPDMRLRVSEELYFSQLQRLRRGEVDVAICGIPEGLASGEFVIEPLLSTRMVVVVRKGSWLRKARSLSELTDAKWVFTGAGTDEGYAKTLFELHGLVPPRGGAVVNSTLALLSLVSSGDFVALMPEQIMRHPLAANFLDLVPVAEGGLPLQVGVMVRSESAVSPAVQQCIAHLHRAAQILG